MARCHLYFLILLLLSLTATALVHDLKIHNDKRPRFFIENFGFEEGGTLQFEIKTFEVDPLPKKRYRKY